MLEKVKFTKWIKNGVKVVVIHRMKKNWSGITFLA